MTGNVSFEYKRAKPLDLSFENLKSFNNVDEFRVYTTGFVSSYRMLGLPRKSRNRYVTASMLLNNNQLTGGLEGIRTFVEKLFKQPDALCWLDLSHNQLTDISGELLTFPNLRTLYMHHNLLARLCAVQTLNRLPGLRSLTMQENPLSEIHGYRSAIIFLIPRLACLDFVLVTAIERHMLPPTSVQRAVKKTFTRPIISEDTKKTDYILK